MEGDERINRKNYKKESDYFQRGEDTKITRDTHSFIKEFFYFSRSNIVSNIQFSLAKNWRS